MKALLTIIQTSFKTTMSTLILKKSEMQLAKGLTIGLMKEFLVKQAKNKDVVEKLKNPNVALMNSKRK